MGAPRGGKGRGRGGARGGKGRGRGGGGGGDEPPRQLLTLDDYQAAVDTALTTPIESRDPVV